MSKLQGEKPKKPLAFHQMKRMAENRYGVANERPQDIDAKLLRRARRTNHGVMAEFPENYRADLVSWIDKLPELPHLVLPEFSMDMVHIQDETNQSKEIVRLVRPPPPPGFGVVAVDFEFHQEYTYDGFICVASVSSPKSTLIVDCLPPNSGFAEDWMVKMLTGVRTLKVFCGCANDVFRMQKDWDCFANGVVDVQDLFFVWKYWDFKDCVQTCWLAAKKQLEERGKQSTDANISAYVQNLATPGLALLIEAFFPNSPVSKDKVMSLADWRKRPIHPELVKYSACDSYYTLQVFYKLYAKVGIKGVKKAANMSIEKLVNRSSLPRYKNNLITCKEGQWHVEQIYKWREYLAINLDKKPEQILNSKYIPNISKEINNAAEELTEKTVQDLLRKAKVGDNHLKAGKLLMVYLEKDGKKLKGMEVVYCHRCNRQGHVAKFCLFELKPGMRREIFHSQQNAPFKDGQNQRRRENWCAKRGLDPVTTICPWEK